MSLYIIEPKSISWQYMHVLIDILKDRKSSTVKGFLLRHSDEIKKVGMDMFMQFRNAVYFCLSDADIVADKYHVIRQANWMIRNVRIRLFNSEIKYREYKKYWKLIVKIDFILNFIWYFMQS